MATTVITPNWLQDVVDGRDGRFDDFPLPVYCTTLESGEFGYVNKAFETLFACKKAELLKDPVTAASPPVTAASFYADGDVRHEWRTELSRKGTVVFDVELQRLSSPKRIERLHVLDCAKVYRRKRRTDALVLGVLIEVNRYAIAWELDRLRLNILQRILDLPSVAVGIHHIDRNGDIQWMNKKERRLLWRAGDWEKASEDWLRKHPNVSLLSESDHAARACRVIRKLRGLNPLSESQHRTFVTQDNTHTPTPVNIHDFGIDNPRPRGGKYAEIVTVVRDERIEPELKSILARFGLRNPLLEEIEVRTFLKVQRRVAQKFSKHTRSHTKEKKQWPDELIFVYGNSCFLGELGRLWDSKRTDFLVRNNVELYERTDAELFRDYAVAYSRTDDAVVRTGDADERIEKHPSSAKDTSIDVQVLKLPLYLDEDRSKPPVGVQCFYWPADDGEHVRNKLRDLHAPWDILDDLPVAVFRKNADKKFTYANATFLTQVQKATGRSKALSLDEVVGKNYSEVFDKDWEKKWAKIYEADDAIVLGGQVKKREGMLGTQAIEVRKTPIRDATGNSVIGVQGVFLEISGARSNEVYVDFAKLEIHFLDENISVSFTYAKEWHVFDVLCRHFGKYVTYEQMTHELPNLNPRGPITRQAIHSYVSDLRRHLKNKPQLGTRLVIDPHTKQGYRLGFQ